MNTRYIHELLDQQRSPGVVLVINVPTLGYLELTLSYDKYQKDWKFGLSAIHNTHLLEKLDRFH
jgi:hypothetical protein